MSISDRVYLARAARKLFQSTYKHNIATLNRKVNHYFCILAMLSLHVLETKKPRSFILGASCQQIVGVSYNTKPPLAAHDGRP